MTIENEDTDLNALESVDVSEVVSKPESLEDALKLLEELQTKNSKLSTINKEVITSRNDVKKKLRKFENETESKIATELAEQGKYKELFEQSNTQLQELQSKIKTNTVDTAMKSALQEAEAISVDAIMKLVDKGSIEFDDDGNVAPDSIKAAIEAIKTSYPILFGSPVAVNLPAPVKRATEGENIGGYEQEVRSAKTQAELAAIMKKYGKA